MQSAYLASHIGLDNEADVFHINRQRNDDKTRDEVDHGQRNDVDRRDQLVLASYEDVQYEGVPRGAHQAEEREHVEHCL
jgi:hypothetical protein